jgi:signal transduction histidine kinase
MRRIPLAILVAVTLALVSMVLIHRQSIDQYQKKQTRIELLQGRQGELRDMSVGLEKYRRLSANFRKMTPMEIDAAHEQLRKSLREGIEKLQQLDPTADETAAMEDIQRNVESMIDFAEKFERTAYNKDAYQKAEMVSYHDGISTDLKQLAESTENRVKALEGDSNQKRDRATYAMIALASLIVLFWLGNWGRVFWSEERPLRRLFRFSEDLRNGTFDPAKSKGLSGVYGDIQSSLTDLFQMVQGHSRERHKFILDVVSDLRSPLAMVSAGKHLLGRGSEKVDPNEELMAIDSVKRGLAVLSGSLEDFDDIVEYSRLDSRLDENLVDLSEMICEVARSLNAGAGLEKQISTSVPPIPVWIRVDARRFQRVLMQSISRVASTLRRGGGIHIQVQQPSQGPFRGVEILIQDAERARDSGVKNAGSGPHVDVLKHWISEKGLGMTLAHRVIKAQGGTITASGVTGTSVQLAIRLPQERLADGGLISAPRGLSVSLGQIAPLGSEDFEVPSGQLES